jgi:hypothetical protein
MGKRGLLYFVAAVAAVFMAAATLQASTQVQDVIKMDNKAYAKHKKPIVEFTHKKHMEEYAAKNPELFKNGCGECHHDDKNKPLTHLKMGDDVKNCIECHSKTGKMEPGDKKLDYFKNAIHENCKGCHKAFNKAHKLKSNSPKAAPTSCNKCHVK